MPRSEAELDFNGRDFATVSVIVPLRNDKLYIHQCLESLAKQTYPAEKLKIIIVDGISDDGSVAIAKDFIDNYRNFSLAQNAARIVPAARNIGLSLATGQYIGMVDSHSYLDADYIERAVGLLRDREEIDCVGGTMKTIGAGYLAGAISSVLCSPFGVGNSSFRISNRELLVDTVPFAVYRRAVFEKIGQFDERLVRNEDNDFHWRLRRQGGKILLTPKINSYYYAPNTLRKFCRQAFRNGLWNIRMVRLVGRRRLAWRHLAPLTLVSALAVAAILAFFGRPELLLAIGLAYLAAALTGIVGARRNGGWRFFPILPMLFLLMHLSYGIGSATGLIEALIPGAWRPMAAGPGSIKKPQRQKENIR
ncbi:MAG: glycosyltransferase family 2 protein [Actinomycetota bacterium]|nr:glycosyltransferase family 2 protein [Actinomycetota bacterium]